MATIKKISGISDAGSLTTAHRLLVEDSSGNLRSTTIGAVNNHTHKVCAISTEGDNRGTNTTPDAYNNIFKFSGLKTNSAINSPSSSTYSYVLGLRGWSDSSGGNSWELAFNDAGIFARAGATTSWGGWRKAWLSGDAVTGAVWNDLIDCLDVPEDDTLEPGYCYCMHEDGHYYKSERYLDSRYIGIDSDTYSLAMGMEAGKRKLNAAVAGFVLAYVDKEYPTGTPLTCTENGILTEIKKEDKCYNPEMIIAKYWKNEEREEIVREDKTVKVNGRKWVKVV